MKLMTSNLRNGPTPQESRISSDGGGGAGDFFRVWRRPNEEGLTLAELCREVQEQFPDIRLEDIVIPFGFDSYFTIGLPPDASRLMREC